MERALFEFDGVWQALTPNEQAKLASMLIERVDFKGTDASIEIHSHATGLESLI